MEHSALPHTSIIIKPAFTCLSRTDSTCMQVEKRSLWFFSSHTVHVACFKCIEQPLLCWASWAQPHFQTTKGASQCRRPCSPATFRSIAFGRTVVPLFIVPPIGEYPSLVLKVWALLYTFHWSSCSNWETLLDSKGSLAKHSTLLE